MTDTKNSDTQERDIRAKSSKPPGLAFIKITYVLIAALRTISVASAMAKIGEEGPALLLENLLLAYISWLIFYGTYKIKTWVVALVLAFAAFSLIPAFFSFFASQADSLVDLLKKAIQGFFVFFCAYQVVVFSRSETRKYFKEKGKILIA